MKEFMHTLEVHTGSYYCYAKELYYIHLYSVRNMNLFYFILKIYDVHHGVLRNVDQFKMNNHLEISEQVN